MAIKVNSTTLENGLKIMTIDLPSFHSITNFLVIRSGSRYENETNNGVAHFLEHLVFKGTRKYKDTAELSSVIDGVGGYFNAWTSNDHTAYWNVVPSAHWQLGVELPFELAFHPKLPSADMERERGVILEEIKMIQDDPARLVLDKIENALFADHPLGLSVIGTSENIKKMPIEAFKEYHQTHYAPNQALFIAVGATAGKDIVGEAEKLLEGITNKRSNKPQYFANYSTKSLSVTDKATDQTHFALGVASPRLSDLSSDSATANVLNTILGRGMSSRLFLNVREKKGLAYAIRSYFTSLEDTGSIIIHGGVNTDKISSTLEALEEEMRDLAENKVSVTELNKAKQQIIGAFQLKSDTPLELATWYGTNELLTKSQSFEEAILQTEKVSAEQVRELAQDLFVKDRLVLSVIGPYKDKTIFEQFLQ